MHSSYRVPLKRENKMAGPLTISRKQGHRTPATTSKQCRSKCTREHYEKYLLLKQLLRVAGCSRSTHQWLHAMPFSAGGKCGSGHQKLRSEKYFGTGFKFLFFSLNPRSITFRVSAKKYGYYQANIFLRMLYKCRGCPPRAWITSCLKDMTTG